MESHQDVRLVLEEAAKYLEPLAEWPSSVLAILLIRRGMEDSMIYTAVGRTIPRHATSRERERERKVGGAVKEDQSFERVGASAFLPNPRSHSPGSLLVCDLAIEIFGFKPRGYFSFSGLRSGQRTHRVDEPVTTDRDLAYIR